MKFHSKKYRESDNLSRYGDYSLALKGDNEIKPNESRSKSLHSKRLYHSRFDECDDEIQDSLHLTRERLMKEEFPQNDGLFPSVNGSISGGGKTSTKNVGHFTSKLKTNGNKNPVLMSDPEVFLNRAKAA
jgi:hypothetical protein